MIRIGGPRRVATQLRFLRMDLEARRAANRNPPSGLCDLPV